MGDVLQAILRAAAVAAATLGFSMALWGCANSCERLCDAYYQMELRCELLACDACQTNSVCTGEEGTPAEYNVLLQEAEYRILQCQADYRRLTEGSDGVQSEEASCQSYVSDMENLVQAYDQSLDDCDHRAYCDEFVDLQRAMGMID